MTWTGKQAKEFFEIVTPNTKYYKEYDMGVELELEYQGIKDTSAIRSVFKRLGWRTVDDNSLRGVSAEHVSPPQSVEKTFTDMKAFDKYCKETLAAPVINNSHRCSTHVHLNFDQAGVTEILKFTSLYYIFEPMLAEIAGPDRKNNCFCVSTRTVPQAIAENIFYKNHFYEDISKADLAKYSSINFCRLHDLGTIEIRLMRGYEKAEKLLNWLTILKDLKMSSKERFNSLKDIEDKYLNLPFLDFVALVFPNAVEAISVTFPDKKVLKKLLSEGYRMSFPLLQTDDMLNKAKEGLEKALKTEQAEENRKLVDLEKIRKQNKKREGMVWIDELEGWNG
jgi:hypothetical protein